ncbi:MAG: tetratricopeptide repeat protein [Methanosarcinaceae archaeon]|nr:tetratricopeptide repeat protein [Methanosarcinaceae archaeon]
MNKQNSEVSAKWTEQGLSEKDPGKKIHYFSLALELDPKNPTALNNKGMLLHRMGKFHEAIECYDRILKQYNMSGYVPALYNKSLALKALGRNEAALNSMKKALKQQSDNERIKDHIDELNLILGKKVEERPQSTLRIPPRQLAVNQVYTDWEPPAVSTLLAHAMKCNLQEIKYFKGFGEDLIKEKAIQDNLSQRIYSCKSCRFRNNNRCQYRDTKGMAVSMDAICRNFRPKSKKE